MQSATLLSAEFIRKKFAKPDSSLGSHLTLFSTFVQKVEREMQGYHSTVVKCSVIEQSLKMLTAEEQTDGAFIFTSNTGSLRIWIRADQSLDGMLCEICLGGSGMVSADREEGRPPSSFEKRLKNEVFKAIALAFMQTAQSVQKINLELTVQMKEDLLPVKKTVEKCITLSLLANAFTMSANLNVSFQLEEFSKIFFQSEEIKHQDAITVQSVLDNTSFGIEAYLAPAQVPLQTIMQLKVGSVLPLGVRVSDPVHVHCQGSGILQAALKMHGDVIELMLLSPDGLEKSFQAMPQNWIG